MAELLVMVNQQRLTDCWADWAARAEPLGVGPVVRVDTSAEVDIHAIQSLVSPSLHSEVG